MATAIWIGAMGARGTSVTGYPYSYNPVTAITGGSNRTTASTYQTITASSESPQAFTQSPADTWAAVTVGVK